MKSVNSILVIILLIVASAESRGQRQASNNDFIRVDVRKNYSRKKELILQNFMDVEYIALETKKDFFNQGVVMDVGKKFMIIKNRVNDGDIFLYDRSGKALRKINRFGQGGEEYTHISSIAIDEDKEELFVNNASKKTIFVYDLYGKFKRSLKVNTMYYEMYNYDREHLICYDYFNTEIAFVLISKKDGSIIKEIKTPFKEKKFLHFDAGENGRISLANIPSIIPFQGNFLLLEHSADTVYSFFPDNSLRPFIVKTPSVQSMTPETVVLYLRLLSDRYYFMETFNVVIPPTGRGSSRKFFMYDKQENNYFTYSVYNGDYSTKKEIQISGLNPVNREIESYQKIEADELFEAYEKGQLKGKLKEIAAKLKEEDNPVIMLIKHKK